MRLLLCLITGHRYQYFLQWLGIEAVICSRCGTAMVKND
jgi:hypothetical protein